MKLDFTTLFAIILLNSVGFAIVWAIISVSYRNLVAARYWFASLMMTFLSGPFLIFGEHFPWLNYAGNVLVILGLGLLWQGIRVFLKKPPLWGWLTLLVLTSILAMVFLGLSQPANNVIFAVGQIIPMGMALLTLLLTRNRQIGTWVAAGSCGLLIIGQTLEAITNTLRLADAMSTDTYYDFASWFLVLAILGVSISNLGFLLMTVDQMRNELYSLAIRDDLTGLPNRRALMKRMHDIEKKAKRSHQCVTTLMIDFDKFKSINDNHGHLAGDAALIHFSDVIKRSLQNKGFFARIGGDEFCVLIPAVDLSESSVLIKSITEAVILNPLIWRDTEFTLSVSIGSHHWSSLSGIPLMLSLSHADDNLIQTKYDKKDSSTFTPIVS
ncbi:GGDEF domain-containing protein [Pseudochrobactrum sp. Wa41.01b-1]|uniref:GGDEF domain-containing protein n=1 Tax=Pseudochrobactrum sp. Wa41.01b-1 TaxID=2864102 RepID=UPI001C68D9D8|nr:GGDEF domain-containing protein [Pseudochrobactrum sp. Wa41.01b-1]QYM73371.1 GGDEF domain-containing protein [Pseudochrobactrum sp. Wa41.01b-1]